MTIFAAMLLSLMALTAYVSNNSMLLGLPICDVTYCDTNQSRTCNHKIRGRLKAIFTYYLILPVISKVLHKKLSCRGLCLLFRTLYLQNILAFVHNKATPCFGCKYIVVVSLQNYLISEWSQSPRFTAPRRRAHIGMKLDIHGQGLYISIAHISLFGDQFI